jgi:threonine dehydratase
VLSGAIDVTNEEVLLLLSGGNLDMSIFRAILKYALVDREQLVRLRVRIQDEPG